MLTRYAVEDYLMRQNATGMHSIGRALVHLYNRQTSMEKNRKQTNESNSEGFNQADAWRGTSDAQFYQRMGYLTRRQMDYWQAAANPNNPRSKPRILKYAGQILEIALTMAKNV